MEPSILELLQGNQPGSKRVRNHAEQSVRKFPLAKTQKKQQITRRKVTSQKQVLALAEMTDLAALEAELLNGGSTRQSFTEAALCKVIAAPLQKGNLESNEF